jgi:hypothetical protein
MDIRALKSNEKKLKYSRLFFNFENHCTLSRLWSGLCSLPEIIHFQTYKYTWKAGSLRFQVRVEARGKDLKKIISCFIRDIFSLSSDVDRFFRK